MKALGVIFCLLAGAAGAQSIQECDWQTHPDSIPEPWEDNSVTFADGQIRVTLLDTIEPSGAPAWLMVLSPPIDEMGSRRCRVIGAGGAGFSDILFQGLEADFDPSGRLTITVDVFVYDIINGDAGAAVLSVMIDQSTGLMSANLR